MRRLHAGAELAIGFERGALIGGAPPSSTRAAHRLLLPTALRRPRAPPRSQQCARGVHGYKKRGDDRLKQFRPWCLRPPLEAAVSEGDNRLPIGPGGAAAATEGRCRNRNRGEVPNRQLLLAAHGSLLMSNSLCGRKSEVGEVA